MIVIKIGGSEGINYDLVSDDIAALVNNPDADGCYAAEYPLVAGTGWARRDLAFVR